MVSGIFSVSCNMLQQIRAYVSENLPIVKDNCKDIGNRLLLWTRRGSPLRSLLVISVGSIALLALTGVLLFMLFFLAATANAIIISLLVSLAAAGGFLAIFFACVAAVYIGALSVAAVVITTATISAVIAILIAAGWIGFFCTLWLVTKKGVGVAKHSLNISRSAISSYSSTRHARHDAENDKVSC